MPSESELQVKVRERANIIYVGTAVALSSYNDRGLFDILPKHANFITIIYESVVIHLADGATQQLPISKGVMRVRSNTVDVYIGV